jgi:cell division protein FtsA
MPPRAAAEVEREAAVLVLDLGTSKALAVLARRCGARLEVVGWAESPWAALQHGVVADLAAARRVLGEVLGEAQRQAGVATRRVVAGVGGGAVRSVRARGTTRSRLPVVLQPAHLDRALDAAADIGLPSDHEILHVLPSGYLVDGARAVRSPLGMRARRLTAEAAVVTVASLALDNLQRVLEDLGYDLVGAAAEPLAAARAGLTDDDRRRGAVLLDLGAEVLGAAAYRDGALQGLAWVAAGGAHVTRDLAYALQLELEQAEALKRRHGAALAEEAAGACRVEIRRGRERVLLAPRRLADVIEARMEELLVMARDGLRQQGALGLGDRVVLAGGGARLRGCVELAEQVFEAPARLAAPVEPCVWPLASGDPACCTAVGLVIYAERSGLLAALPPPSWARAVHRLRRVLSERRGVDVGRVRSDRGGAASLPRS